MGTTAIILLIILLILVTGTLNAVCFFIGAKVAQKIKKDEPIQLPSLDPMKPIRERENRRKAEREQQKYEVILQNIDNYDGTSLSQKDVPI